VHQEKKSVFSSPPPTKLFEFNEITGKLYRYQTFSNITIIVANQGSNQMQV
jgi:hypothetical protein